MSAELSALLAELARIPEVELDLDATWAPALKPGDVVGRFELQQELGRGGFGVVYEALDRELGRPVAFKAVRPGRRLQGRSDAWLRSEAEAVARLNHPNIVTLHDFGRGPNGAYLIFELLRGATLADRLRAGPLPVRDAVDVAVDVARVLAHAHAAEVVHRDLKPANVFLSNDGTVKVLDFGLAHLFGRAGPGGGTPAYMAPEQWRGEPGDARTDLFALGVLLHHMLSGAVPYRVTRERSEALDPGPPPELPRADAPGSLRRLVSRLLEKDTAARPGSAQEALDVLLPLQERLHRAPWTRRRRALVALAAGLAVAAGAAALFAQRRAATPAAPLVVAVADFENGTGEDDLDGLSGLLITSLEQSRRFRVLARSRLVGLLGRTGSPGAARIDEPIARELARAAGAGVVLVAAVRRADDAYALELRGEDPRDGRLFTVEERAPAKADVLGAVDRLSDAVRRALRERADHVRAARIEVAQAVTPSFEAYQAYFEGQDCVDRPSQAGSWTSVASACADYFRRALALDPTFALAHYQLAYLLGTESPSDPDLPAHMEAALRYVDRVPPKEATLVRAWKAHLDRRDDEALALYGSILADFPDDVQALYLTGLIHYQAGALGVAVPFFEKGLSVQPGAENPLDLLVSALGALRRRDDLKALLARVAEGPPTPAAAHAAVRGLVWLGDGAGALEAARRAVEAGGGPAAAGDLAGALSAAGRFAELEAELRRRLETEPFQPGVRYSLASAIRTQGRRAEARRVLDEVAARVPGSILGEVQYVRAMHAAGDGDAAVLWREVAKVKGLAPELAGDFAVVLALTGDLPHAAELAPFIPERSTAAEEVAALVAWRTGDAADAAARLSALDARDPWPEAGLAPSYLLAEVSAAARDPSATIAAVQRLRSLWPRGSWRSWAVPRSAYLAAVAYEDLGEREAARAELDRLLGWMQHADPDLPLAREARALRARLGQ